jgi:hypothetical protein
LLGRSDWNPQALTTGVSSLSGTTLEVGRQCKQSLQLSLVRHFLPLGRAQVQKTKRGDIVGHDDGAVSAKRPHKQVHGTRPSFSAVLIAISSGDAGTGIANASHMPAFLPEIRHS